MNTLLYYLLAGDCQILPCSLFSNQEQAEVWVWLCVLGKKQRKLFSGDFSIANPPVRTLEKFHDPGKQIVTLKAESPEGNLDLPFQL